MVFCIHFKQVTCLRLEIGQIMIAHYSCLFYNFSYIKQISMVVAHLTLKQEVFCLSSGQGPAVLTGFIVFFCFSVKILV